ncbi:MAG: hypothetical protein LBK74_07565 [Treponema sp.]|nr:hypothetical protein [Treponema sp.]
MTKRAKKEKDRWDPVLDQIDFKGLTREEVLGQDGLVKQLTGRLLQRILETGMDAQCRGVRYLIPYYIRN